MKSTANVEWCTRHTRKQIEYCTKNGINGDNYCGKFFPTGQCHNAFSISYHQLSGKRPVSVCVPKQCDIDNSELVKEIMSKGNRYTQIKFFLSTIVETRWHYTKKQRGALDVS